MCAGCMGLCGFSSSVRVSVGVGGYLGGGCGEGLLYAFAHFVGGFAGEGDGEQGVGFFAVFQECAVALYEQAGFSGSCGGLYDEGLRGV